MLRAFLSRGQLDWAVAAVAAYQTVVSTKVRTVGQKVKLVGTVLHISKAKTVGYTRTFAEKKDIFPSRFLPVRHTCAMLT